MEYKNIKAILFDSGRTLNVPRTGHWFITPNFFNIVNKENFEINENELELAMEKACNHINKILTVITEEEEFLMFKEFYEIVLNEIKYPYISKNIINDLAKDNVYNDEKFLFFDDVQPSLEKLSDRYILGVVSDTWPSLERVFINKDLRKYFKTFVMSSIHGSYKSEKKLFRLALDEIKLNPKEVIFVDESDSNLLAAEDFGLVPKLIDRYEQDDLKSKYPIIRSLEELL